MPPPQILPPISSALLGVLLPRTTATATSISTAIKAEATTTTTPYSPPSQMPTPYLSKSVIAGIVLATITFTTAIIILAYCYWTQLRWRYPPSPPAARGGSQNSSFCVVERRRPGEDGRSGGGRGRRPDVPRMVLSTTINSNTQRGGGRRSNSRTAGREGGICSATLAARLSSLEGHDTTRHGSQQHERDMLRPMLPHSRPGTSEARQGSGSMVSSPGSASPLPSPPVPCHISPGRGSRDIGDGPERSRLMVGRDGNDGEAEEWRVPSTPPPEYTRDPSPMVGASQDGQARRTTKP